GREAPCDLLHLLGPAACILRERSAVQWSQLIEKLRGQPWAATKSPMEKVMKFRAYIVEDSPTILENLIETLQELALVDPVGTAETEYEGKKWLAQNDAYWDLVIIDLFLKEGSGLNIVEACRYRRPSQKV